MRPRKRYLSSPEEIARREAHVALLATVREAIQARRAYLDTAFGRRYVTGYNDDSGWANTIDERDRDNPRPNMGRSFMTTLDGIKIVGEEEVKKPTSQLSPSAEDRWERKQLGG